eukprot:CAMPEP_0206216488 /NCGR_PEP_ID=MMETSP0047_2-20121206/2746_1 /ASSEMBLY_ACC=CAM_ASM_000192 /TAXON_ID=195065 /ORGANISM="Chroomonas mesostigmatica_cf, Strain CCMP1168" /LENGTH=330 /DNA_ID=CAMNT_0053638835 /DNA_START=115 /DNA_END=1104 /DNA_ORIENTATION=-
MSAERPAAPSLTMGRRSALLTLALGLPALARADEGADEELSAEQERLEEQRYWMREAIDGINQRAEGAPRVYENVRKDIGELFAQDPNFAPTAIRLAWHSSGTYDKMSKSGGPRGTIRFKEELRHEANAGLDMAVRRLEPIKQKHKHVSYADLYTLAGVVAIEVMGGPQVKWRRGRKDSMSIKDVTPNGRLPDADKGTSKDTAAHLRQIFGRMGFNDQEIVVLSGAHSVGQCHPGASGYSGPWSPVTTNFNNIYFKYLTTVKWTPETVPETGKMQYGARAGMAQVMMLPSDIALVEDDGFRPYVEKYAQDKKAFFDDFSVAFEKLLELGT